MENLYQNYVRVEIKFRVLFNIVFQLNLVYSTKSILQFRCNILKPVCGYRKLSYNRKNIPTE